MDGPRSDIEIEAMKAAALLYVDGRWWWYYRVLFLHDLSAMGVRSWGEREREIKIQSYHHPWRNVEIATGRENWKKLKFFHRRPGKWSSCWASASDGAIVIILVRQFQNDEMQSWAVLTDWNLHQIADKSICKTRKFSHSTSFRKHFSDKLLFLTRLSLWCFQIHVSCPNENCWGFFNFSLRKVFENERKLPGSNIKHDPENRKLCWVLEWKTQLRVRMESSTVCGGYHPNIFLNYSNEMFLPLNHLRCLSEWVWVCVGDQTRTKFICQQLLYFRYTKLRIENKPFCCLAAGYETFIREIYLLWIQSAL